MKIKKYLISRYIKSRRISWLGHEERLPVERIIKSISYTTEGFPKERQKGNTGVKTQKM